MTGKSYYGFRTATTLDRETKRWIQDVPKSERRMGARCNSELCAKGTHKHCSSIPEESRLEMFHHFWNDLDWRAKRAHVRSLVDTVPPKRRRPKHKGAVSRKGDTRLYHLTHHNRRLPVCRVMFLNTLGVKEAMVRCWMAGDKPRLPKTPLKTLDVTTYLSNLPTSPPKCPRCTGVSYVSLEGVKNLHQLYNLYVKQTLSGGGAPASRKTFSNAAAALNVRFFRPKSETDVCDLVGQHNAPELSTCELAASQVDYYYDQW